MSVEGVGVINDHYTRLTTDKFNEIVCSRPHFLTGMINGGILGEQEKKVNFLRGNF